jgi:hypothetical protein
MHSCGIPPSIIYDIQLSRAVSQEGDEKGDKSHKSLRVSMPKLGVF